MRVSRDFLVLAFLFVVLVAGAVLVASPSPHEESKISTTYNADPEGVKAFYTLLSQRMGRDVGRLTLPYTKIPRSASVLFVVEPVLTSPIDEDETAALSKWVRGGGTVVFLVNDLIAVPKPFTRTRSLGRGMIYALSSRRPITNRGMRDYRNALKMLDIIDKASRRRGTVLFDEYHHGISDDSSQGLLAQMSRPVKVSILMLAVAGLVLCHTRGRRFGAVRPLESSLERRPGFEFVEAMARLYQRAGASGLAADILLDTFRHKLAARAGVSPDAGVDDILRGLGPGHGGDTAQALRRLLDRSQAGQKLSESELVTIAGEIRRLEEELGLARYDI